MRRPVMFPIAKLALGGATGTDLRGRSGPFPPPLEHTFGTRVGGIISRAFFVPYRVTFDFDSHADRAHVPGRLRNRL